MMYCRVYVVHAHSDSGLAIFSVANKIGMMTSGYVCITTDWLLSALDSSEIPYPKSMDLIQGGIKDKQTSNFNSYALYAYDYAWFLKSGGSNFGLSALRTFIEGDKLLQTILATTFMGLTGEMKFDREKNLMHPTYDVVNIGGTGLRTIGYCVIWPGEMSQKPRGGKSGGERGGESGGEISGGEIGGESGRSRG
ncbi:glutamate receptor 3.4-like protein [Tanacetum coccineum]